MLKKTLSHHRVITDGQGCYKVQRKRRWWFGWDTYQKTILPMIWIDMCFFDLEIANKYMAEKIEEEGKKPPKWKPVREVKVTRHQSLLIRMPLFLCGIATYEAMSREGEWVRIGWLCAAVLLGYFGGFFAGLENAYTDQED